MDNSDEDEKSDSSEEVLHDNDLSGFNSNKKPDVLTLSDSDKDEDQNMDDGDSPIK